MQEVPGKRHPLLPSFISGFHVDLEPVSVGAFREFIQAGLYGQQTDEEKREIQERIWTEKGMVWLESQAWRPPELRSPAPHRDRLPIRDVSWFDAVAYCHWRTYRAACVLGHESECEFCYPLEGGRPALDCGFRLPTKAEMDMINMCPPIRESAGLSRQLLEWCSDLCDAGSNNMPTYGTMPKSDPVGVIGKDYLLYDLRCPGQWRVAKPGERVATSTFRCVCRRGSS